MAILLAVIASSDSPSGGSDAQVNIALPAGAAVDTIRQEITQLADTAWDGRRVVETSDSPEQSTVVIAMPGTSLDGAISWLRNPRNTGARSVTVNVDVDPAKLEGDPPGLAAGDASDGEEKDVRLEVVMSAAPASGPWPAVILALLVAGLALGGLWWVQRNSVKASDSFS